MSEKIKVTGSPMFDQHPHFGERITLIVHGAFDRRAQTFADDGEITETYTFTVEEAVEPGEDLLEAAFDRIKGARDRRAGRTPLPLDTELQDAAEEFVEAMDAAAGEGNWSVELHEAQT